MQTAGEQWKINLQLSLLDPQNPTLKLLDRIVLLLLSLLRSWLSAQQVCVVVKRARMAWRLTSLQLYLPRT